MSRTGLLNKLDLRRAGRGVLWPIPPLDLELGRTLRYRSHYAFPRRHADLVIVACVRVWQRHVLLARRIWASLKSKQQRNSGVTRMPYPTSRAQSRSNRVNASSLIVHHSSAVAAERLLCAGGRPTTLGERSDDKHGHIS